MKRAWSGDVYAALRDCLAALAADPRHLKAGLEKTRVIKKPAQWFFGFFFIFLFMCPEERVF
jgi:hypothetical protein